MGRYSNDVKEKGKEQEKGNGKGNGRGKEKGKICYPNGYFLRFNGLVTSRRTHRKYGSKRRKNLRWAVSPN